MAETKYGKYFITYDSERWRSSITYSIPAVLRLEDSVVKGCNFYFVSWVFPEQKPPEGPASAFIVGHPPHTHPYAEILMHIGTDHNNPSELGAEVEIYMGPEMEKHIITKTCAVYIPPNFIHCPYRVVKTFRPWIVVQIVQGPKRVEELRPEVLPENIRNKIDWSFWERLRESY